MTDNTNDPVGVLRSALEQISYVADMGTPNGRMLFDIAKTALAAIQHSEQRETVPAGEPIYQIANDSVPSGWSDVGKKAYDMWTTTMFRKKRKLFTSPVAAPVPEAKAEQVDEYEDCPKCTGSSIKGEVRGVRCSYCDGRSYVAAPAVKHEASELAEYVQYTVDGKVMSPLEYIDHLHDKLRIGAAPPIVVQGSVADDAEFGRLLTEHYNASVNYRIGVRDRLVAYIDSRSPVAAAPIGAVLTYTVTGHGGVGGQAIGADGAGDFVVIFHGTTEQADAAARLHIKRIEQSRQKFKACILVHNEEGWFGPVISHIDAALSAAAPSADAKADQ